jgi:hypothetical protein
MSSALQLNDLATQLGTYNTQVQAFLTNPATAVPSFEDFIELLKYEDILTDALNDTTASANFTTGALVDTVQFVLGIIREFSMRSATKSAYYGDAIDDLGDKIASLEAWYGEYYNYFRGSSPIQKVSA